MAKKLIILLIAIAPIAAFAQNKLAHLNSQEIFNAMPELGNIEKELAKKQEEITKNGQALESEYTKKAEEFQKISSTASETQKADLQKQLEQINERYQLFARGRWACRDGRCSHVSC